MKRYPKKSKKRIDKDRRTKSQIASGLGIITFVVSLIWLYTQTGGLASIKSTFALALGFGAAILVRKILD